MNLKALQLRLAELKNKQKSDAATLETLSDLAAEDALLTQMEADEVEMEHIAKKISKIVAANGSEDEEGGNTKAAGASNGAPALGVQGQESLKAIAMNSRFGELKNISGENAEIKALATGLWFAANVLKKSWAVDKLKDLAAKFTDSEIQAVNQNVTSDPDGGLVVPQQISIQIDKVAEKLSIYRRDAKLEPMTGTEKKIITNDHGLKMAFEDELTAGPLSKLQFGQYSLENKKVIGYVATSKEFEEDAVVAVGDTLVGEFGVALADIITATGFFADGSATFKGMIGLLPRILGLNADPAKIGSVYVKTVAANKGWDDITRTDMITLANMVAATFRRGGDEGLKWYTTQEFYLSVMVRILEQGVFTMGDLQRGTANAGREFLGFPVEFIPENEAIGFGTYALPSVYANGSVPCFFGNLSKVALFGSRKELSVERSEHAIFHLDGILYKGRSRFGVGQIPKALGVANTDPTLRKKGAVAFLYVKTAA